MKLVEHRQPWWQGQRQRRFCRRPWHLARTFGGVDEGLSRLYQENAALLVGCSPCNARFVPASSLRSLPRWLRRGWVLWRMAVAVERILPASELHFSRAARFRDKTLGILIGSGRDPTGLTCPVFCTISQLRS